MFAQAKQLRGELGELVTELEPRRLDADAAARLVEEFAAIERLAAAAKLLVAKRVADTRVWRREGDRSAAHRLARHSRASVGQAIGVLEAAERLRELPATEDALRAGELSAAQLGEITAAAVVNPNAETQLLSAAREEGIARLQQRCRRVKAACADEVTPHEAIRRSRYLRHRTETDGAFRMDVRTTPDAGATVLAALEPHRGQIFREARAAGRREPADAYAADALVRLAQTNSHGSRSEPRTMVHVRVDHGAFLRGHTAEGEVCEVPGVGSIPLATTRALAGDAILVGVVAKGRDVTTVPHLGRTIPTAVRRALEARDPECVVPACSVRDHLEIDHRVPFAQGGPTRLDNLARLCSWHHYLKTHHGYRLDGRPGEWRWTPLESGSHDRSPPDQDLETAPPLTDAVA